MRRPARVEIPRRSISITDLKPFADIPVTSAGKFPAAAQMSMSIVPKRWRVSASAVSVRL